MGRILLINFREVDVTALRVKVSDEIIFNNVAELQEYLQQQLIREDPAYHLGGEEIEILDAKTGLYNSQRKDMEAILRNWKRGFLSILLTERKPSNTIDSTLAICGRLFDLRDGLPLCNRTLFIHDDSDHAELGTGLNTWDGSIVLAKALEKNVDFIVGKKILELGAGTGIAGLAAGFIGASHVLLTDLSYVLDNLRNNIKLNWRGVDNGEYNEATESEAQPLFSVQKLDWADPSTYPRDENGTLIEWDVILGADVVWLEHLVPPLVQCISTVATEQTQLLLSHQTRSERADRLLFDSLRKEGFFIETLPYNQLNTEYVSPNIHVLQINRSIK